MQKEAIILAGGFGTRLKSVIAEIPKPMAPIGDKPFLQYLLDYLEGYGFSKVVLSVGYQHQVIIDYFGYQYKSIKLEYAIENTPMGTGGGIALALEKCSASHVVILNGDTFFKVDIDRLIQQCISEYADIVLSLKEMQNFDRYGIVTLSDNRITGFCEKQSVESGVINGGVYCIKRLLLNQLGFAGKFSFETDFLEKYCQTLAFNALISNGYFIDIGIPDDYQKAEVDFKQFDHL